MAADSKAKHRKEAEKYMFQGKIKQAIGEYSKIVQVDPNDVLTLNTIGDLYLTIGNAKEANNCFVKVAENYVRNHFFLKAIAVYKKILNADPKNQEINATIASLYAQQGLNTDACNQYLRLAGLYEQSGDKKKILNTYNKIVELDPANAAIQKKLAEAYLAEGNQEKGREHLISTARALVKSGNPSGAMHCFEQADQIAPLDTDRLKDFLECCLKTDNIPVILDRLQGSLTSDPHNPDIREMLARAHLAGKNPEAAADTLHTVVASDESRYNLLLPVVQTFIELEKYDQATECLATILPALITRREPDVAIEYLKQVLEHCPSHLMTMEKLALAYSSARYREQYQEILDKIINLHIEQQDTTQALENLEKLLQTNPESQKHLDLHKKLFVEANPDTPYVAPVATTETPVDEFPVQDLREVDGPTDNTPETIVEADLLINYGMKEKALGLLKNLEARNPYDKKVRTRLLTLFKEEKKFTEAAEQCLLLSVLYGKSNNEESVEKYMSEAKQLDSDIVDREKDLEAFARKRGIITESEKSDPEVDGDLLDLFFTGEQGGVPEDVSDIPTMPDEIPEGYAEGLPSTPPTQSIEEKLQEVDFYIRLGFSDEASNKLNEIAKISPDNPELPPRYEKLNQMEASKKQEFEETSDGEKQTYEETPEEEEEEEEPENSGIFEEMEIEAALKDFTNSEEESSESQTDSGALSEVASEARPEQPQNNPPQDSSGFVILEQQDDAVELDLSADLSADLESASEQTSGQLQAATSPDSPDFAILEQQDDAVELDLSADISVDPQLASEQTSEQLQVAPSPDSPDFVVNDMFSDLLDEVSTLSEQEIAKESYEDHFSLGTAYRDMDLIEEAIKEFQTALRITESSKDARKRVQCCGMLSTCFLKKSMPRSALRWCQTGLNVEGITTLETMALRYDMGVAYSMEGNKKLALQCFDRIFNTDPGYRDVAQQIDEIKSGRD